MSYRALLLQDPSFSPACKRGTAIDAAVHNASPTAQLHRPEPAVTGSAHVAKLAAVIALAVAGLCHGPATAAGLLGSAQSFAVLARGTVTNAHNPPQAATQVYGDVGVAPGTAITGFAPSGTVTGGSLHSNDATAQAAMADAQAAFASAAGMVAGTDLTGQDLGTLGQALTPGVYHFASSAALTGTLVLDFLNDPAGSFVFQIASTLTTASNSAVLAINAGPQSSIYWQVGSSATLGMDSSFAGNVLAAASVSLDPGVQWRGGRAFALGGAVTLIDNLLTSDCVAGPLGTGCVDGGSLGFSGGPAIPIPEPAAPLLMLAGLAAVALVVRARPRG